MLVVQYIVKLFRQISHEERAIEEKRPYVPLHIQPEEAERIVLEAAAEAGYLYQECSGTRIRRENNQYVVTINAGCFDAKRDYHVDGLTGEISKVSRFY